MDNVKAAAAAQRAALVKAAMEKLEAATGPVVERGIKRAMEAEREAHEPEAEVIEEIIFSTS